MISFLPLPSPSPPPHVMNDSPHSCGEVCGPDLDWRGKSVFKNRKSTVCIVLVLRMAHRK